MQLHVEEGRPAVTGGAVLVWPYVQIDRLQCSNYLAVETSC
jgi:hypothetical protein